MGARLPVPSLFLLGAATDLILHLAVAAFRKTGTAGNRTRDLLFCSQKLGPLDHRGSPLNNKSSLNLGHSVYHYVQNPLSRVSYRKL
jgi:hypothetical protein